MVNLLSLTANFVSVPVIPEVDNNVTSNRTAHISLSLA